MFIQLLENILAIAGSLAISFLIAVLFWFHRKGKFSVWWEAEGIVIFIIGWFIVSVILIERGCFHNL